MHLNVKKKIIFSTANRGHSCAYIYISNETCFYRYKNIYFTDNVRNLNRIGNS